MNNGRNNKRQRLEEEVGQKEDSQSEVDVRLSEELRGLLVLETSVPLSAILVNRSSCVLLQGTLFIVLTDYL